MKEIAWQPYGDKYAVRFNDGSAQLYGADGTAIGAPLANVWFVNWNFGGETYSAGFNDDSGQEYSAADGTVSLRADEDDPWILQNI